MTSRRRYYILLMKAESRWDSQTKMPLRRHMPNGAVGEAQIWAREHVRRHSRMLPLAKFKQCTGAFST